MNYKVYQGTELKQTVTSKTAVMNGLQPNRTYDFSVQADNVQSVGGKTRYTHVAYANMTYVSIENSSFTLSERATVRFGAGNNWVYKAFDAGTYTASNATFGRDPCQGVTKGAEVVSDFSVEQGSNKTYIGFYTDFTQADSTNPLDYTWSPIRDGDATRYGINETISVTTRGIRFNIPKTLTVGSTITLRYEEYPLGIVPIGNEPSGMFGGGNKQNLSAKVISTANGSSVVEVAGNVIDVGGANLFQGSQLFTGQAEVKSSQYVKSTIEDYDSTTKMLHLVSNGTANSSSGCYWRSPIIDSGTTWTFSADMKGSGRLSVMKRENSTGPYVLNSMLTDSWTRYWNTGTLTTNSGGAWCIYFDDTTVKLDAYIKLIKVETGDTATPYAAFVDGDTFTAQPDGTCALFSEYKALYY